MTEIGGNFKNGHKRVVHPNMFKSPIFDVAEGLKRKTLFLDLVEPRGVHNMHIWPIDYIIHVLVRPTMKTLLYKECLGFNHVKLMYTY